MYQWPLRALTLSVFLILASCGIDTGDGSQFAGQRCFSESDCAVGLTCFERVCVPVNEPPPVTDAGPDASEQDLGVAPDSGGGFFDTGPDAAPCVEGEARCDGLNREVCQNGSWVLAEVCDNGIECLDGECVEIGDCADADEDGFNAGCPGASDCDDNDPSVNPDAEESCATSHDDDCDGQINENCGECCAGGCPEGSFCAASCECQAYDPEQCQYQNQPCTQEGQFVNGLYCASLGEDGALRCYGVCDRTADDPNATCPEPNSVCAFGEDQGICLTSCTFAEGCGEGLGCLANGGSAEEGVCVPSNPENQLGDDCNADNFFDCDANLVCVNFQGGAVGQCREACRAFAHQGTQTDCGQGHCLPLSPSFGLCFEDNAASEGETCTPPFSACNDDAVGCYPEGMQSNRCQRICRLDEGNADCPSGSCRQFDPGQEELGLCI